MSDTLNTRDAYRMPLPTESVAAEDIRVGDWIGWPCNGLVVEIAPYVGRFPDIVFAVAKVSSGNHMSLCHGQIVNEVVRGHRDDAA